MSDPIDRLHRAILAIRDGDAPASESARETVRKTARLLEQGPPKLAKKLAEEAVETALEAVAGDREAVVRESADLIYQLAALWAGLGVAPADVWAEMERRERLHGMAGKLPKEGRRGPRAVPRAIARAEAGAPGRPV